MVMGNVFRIRVASIPVVQRNAYRGTRHLRVEGIGRSMDVGDQIRAVGALSVLKSASKGCFTVVHVLPQHNYYFGRVPCTTARTKSAVLVTE